MKERAGLLLDAGGGMLEGGNPSGDGAFAFQTWRRSVCVSKYRRGGTSS